MKRKEKKRMEKKRRTTEKKEKEKRTEKRTEKEKRQELDWNTGAMRSQQEENGEVSKEMKKTLMTKQQQTTMPVMETL